MTSSDGITWDPQAPGSANSWTSVAWSAELGLLVAVSADGHVMTSANGTAWTSGSAASGNTWRSVTWSPELGVFAAVSDDGHAMSSPDGILWTSRTAPNNIWESVSWSPELGLFAAAAGDGHVMTSPDGLVWTSTTGAPTGSWTSITWSPELGIFAAVANTGSDNKVMLSLPAVAYGPGIVPVGAIIAWHKSFSHTPSLPPEFVECHGQTLSDPQSAYDGAVIPNLNTTSSGGKKSFLRGSATSGATGGSDRHTHDGTTACGTTTIPVCGGGSAAPATGSHTHTFTTDETVTLPDYFEVVWIMRVK